MKIKLARGLPPLSVMKKLIPDISLAMKKSLDSDPKSFLQYGHFAGYQPLREIMAKKFKVSANRVIVGNSSMDTLNLFLLFLKQTQELKNYIYTEAVYDRPLKIAEALHMNIQSVHLKEDGVDLENLKDTLEKTDDLGVVYSIPWFDNPTGIQHTEANREDVADIVKKKGWYLIRDGAYIDLDYHNTPIIPEVCDNVIQTFTFSKTISAGMHVGGIIIPESLSESFIDFITSWRLSPVLPTQMAVCELISSGIWEKHMQEVVIPDGKKRTEYFNKLMDEFLPESKKRDIMGGHFWGGRIEGITLENWDEFVRIADEEYDVHIPDPKGFMPLSKPEDRVGFIRIPLFMEEDGLDDPLRQIVEGVYSARERVCV
ncbi:aminotransferase class I/II-fold pyridoxal phosphate-dependent enzyme [Candidatus Peregrinibacteria bacterium]|jgi:DNA-binding transcriptional MocR family regulator|nr:aminotransferase class I/II-fold pyridoxal phosphate-dependent enzyme [Candidatus Peregrinibacteria bacterium]